MQIQVTPDCDGLLLNPVKFKTVKTLGGRSFAVVAPETAEFAALCN